jgi:hypothetical protein
MGAKAGNVPEIAELIDLWRVGEAKDGICIAVPAWYCRICGSAPVLWHTRRVRGIENVSQLRRVKVPLG